MKGAQDLSSIPSTPQTGAVRPEPDGNSAPPVRACSRTSPHHSPTMTHRTKAHDNGPKTMKHNIPHRYALLVQFWVLINYQPTIDLKYFKVNVFIMRYDL